jgi:hypothetical protein
MAATCDPPRDLPRLVTARLVTGRGLETLRESRYFWERNYGSKSFRVLLSRLPGLVEVKKDRSSSDMLVSLVAPRPDRKAAPRRARQS